MSTHTLMIEIFSAPGCNKCGRAFRLAESVLKEMGETSIQLRQVNIVEELDYAVDLGIRATPAIAINGALAFTAMPDEHALRKLILKHMEKT